MPAERQLAASGGERYPLGVTGRVPAHNDGPRTPGARPDPAKKMDSVQAIPRVVVALTI